MTETEELKKQAHDAHVKGQIESVSKYLDTLASRLDEYNKRVRSSNVIYLLMWITWVIGSIFAPELWEILMFGWFLSLIYDYFWTMKRHGAAKEFLGAITVLELLGMIPPMGGEREKKKRRVWSEGVEMIKEWAKRKEKLQKEAYVPA